MVTPHALSADSVGVARDAGAAGLPADSETTAREFLATLRDPRAPWHSAFVEWCAARGMTVRDAKPILTAILRVRVADATERFRSRTRTAR